MSVKLSKRKGAETKASSVATAQPINVQNFVDKKLAVNKTIEVTTPTAFPNDESDANNWSISVLVKYLKEILELPQYVEKFKRCEIDGSKFISMDESNLSAIEVTNQFHALKISSHAQILREQVLEKAMVEKPESVLDWGPNHIAAWLFYEKSCPETAVRVLKAKLTGYKMKSTTGKNAVSSMKALDLPEAAKAINSLDELAQKAKMAENNATNANINDNERKLTENDAKATIDQGVSNDDQVGTDSKPKKSKTAMKKSREKLKAVEMNSGNNKLDVRSEDGDEKCRNDSLPEEQTAYGTAMSAIYSGVQHIVGRSAVVGSTPLTPIVELTDSEGDDKIPYTSSSAPSHKKKKHLKRVGKNINELPESESEFIPEDESKQSASIPVHPPDIYTKSSERKKFLSKITNLRKVVAEHASSMSELRQHAQQLRSENVAIKEQQKQLLMQGTHSSELISSLVEDRNVALAELERITSLYGQHATAERDEAVRDLQLLARDTYKAKRETQEIWQSHNAQLSQLGNLNVNSTPTSATVLPQAQPVGNGTRTREKHRLRQSDDSDSSGSDLDNMPNKLQPAAAVPKTNRDIIAATTDLPTTPVPVPKTVEKDAPRVPQQTTVALLPTDIPVIKGSQHPVSVAKELLSQSTTLGPATASVPSSGGNKAAPVDLMRLVEKSADSVHTLWLSIMRTYRMPRSYTTEHISDSKLLLRYIAVHWQRLGHRMLRDAHSPETDKDVRKALKGLERCAKTSVLGATRAAKRALESSINSPVNQSTSGKATAGALNYSSNMIGTKSFKRGGRELGSTAFPENGLLDAQEGERAGQQDAAGGEANHFYRAAGMVFGLALVHRVINRYSADQEDRTQLLYLLNKVNHGELPITEISRDNMKDFLDSHIGVELKWDKFDSLCQRLDPDRNGFISTPSVILTFEQLTPLVDRLPWKDAQANILLLLSIATDTLAKAKVPINETFMSLILHNAKSSPSFAKYIHKEQERIEDENRGFRADPTSPRSHKLTGDARIAEQQLFVTDVLYELSKEFVYKMEAAPQLNPKTIPKSKKAELKESQEQFQHSRKDLKYIAQNHQEVCIGVSKGLQVYEGFSRKNLISHLSTLCLTFLNFRRKVVTTLLETHGSQAHHPSSESGLSNTQLDCVLKRIERNIAILTGQFTPEEESDPSSATFSPLRAKRKEPEVITLAPDDTSLSEYELLLAELLGIPLPRNSFAGESGGENVLKGLARFQIQAESVLFCTAQHFALEESLANLAAAEADAPKPLATSQALKDLQKSLYQELWQDTAPDSLPDAPTHHPHFDGEEAFSPVKSVRTQPTDALPPLHVVEEVNDLMHQQRVEQSRHYLEILNEKATRRKKMIRGLMNLWQAAKAAIVDHNKVPVFAAAGDIELKRLQAMPVEDIIAQTKSIQQLLIRDMQEKSSTKMAQLSQRINLLRQGVASQSIPDDDHALSATLREIGALENGLLQANTDAMRLAARIIKQLTMDQKPHK